MLLKPFIEVVVFNQNDSQSPLRHRVLFLEKSSKDLKRRDCDEIVATMVQSGLFETEEAEAFAWDIGNFEVCSGVLAIQVVVVVSTINFRP